MSGPNIPLQKIKDVQDSLNEKSPSFCLAKWLQVSLHLQNGQTHSCHHPATHKIPLHEIKVDPSALHNTSTKKSIRKQMLEGSRPEECQYCWNIEDSSPDSLSDRSLKSAQPWSVDRMNEIKDLDWDKSVTPSYVEVSFGSECNFKCAYCAPHISSSILNEVKKFGPYSSMDFFSIENLTKNKLLPIPKEDPNPYVDAFWSWWPKLSLDIKVFRITGGEPLLNPNTFRFLEHLKNNPMPHLTLAINTNLGVPPATFEKFLSEIKFITSHKLIKEFQLFTSVDTYGKHAEFIRFGLDYKYFMKNVKTYLREVKDSELIFMCAYNAFSVLKFQDFLKDVVKLKQTFYDSKGNTRITLDMPYLKDPSFLSCYVLTKEFSSIIKKDVEFLKENSRLDTGEEIIYQTEISKLERILTWVENLEESEHRNSTRKELMIYLREFEKRKGIKFIDYIPEYKEFLDYCESL